MQDFQTDIIILRGCPGSGKSQTAKSLSQFFPRGTRLEVDAIRQMVISVDWKNQEEHINILELSTGMVRDFLKYGFKPVIVIDTFSGDKIKKYLKSLSNFNSDYIIRTFALYVSEDELKKRIDKREKDQFRDFDICKKLNSDVLRFKEERDFLIDTTGIESDQTAKIIYQALSQPI